MDIQPVYVRFGIPKQDLYKAVCNNNKEQKCLLFVLQRYKDEAFLIKNVSILLSFL